MESNWTNVHDHYHYNRPWLHLFQFCKAAPRTWDRVGLLPTKASLVATDNIFNSGSEAILMQKAAKLGLSKIENAFCVFLSSYF